MRKFIFCLPILGAVACDPVAPLTEYTPIVDPGKVSAARFQKDLVECRNLALQVEAEYKAKQEKEATQNLLAGMLVGALVGAAVGNNSGYQHDYITAGALAGASGAVGSGDYTYDLVTFGPRRVVDRCMTGRGYNILSDIGRG